MLLQRPQYQRRFQYQRAAHAPVNRPEAEVGYACPAGHREYLHPWVRRIYGPRATTYRRLMLQHRSVMRLPPARHQHERGFCERDRSARSRQLAR